MLKKIILAVVLLPIAAYAQQKVTIIPSAGYAFRTAKSADNLSSIEKEHIKKLKRGFNFDVSAYYSINNTVGIGIKYNNFSSSATTDFSVYNAQTMSFDKVSVTTNDNIMFIGPSILYSNFSEDTKHKLYYDLALGLITYKTKTGSQESVGSNLGLSGNLGYQYAVSPNIFVGPLLGYTTGVIKKFKVNGRDVELQEGNYEGLSRISLGAGVVFRF